MALFGHAAALKEPVAATAPAAAAAAAAALLPVLQQLAAVCPAVLQSPVAAAAAGGPAAAPFGLLLLLLRLHAAVQLQSGCWLGMLACWPSVTGRHWQAGPAGHQHLFRQTAWQEGAVSACSTARRVSVL